MGLLWHVALPLAAVLSSSAQPETDAMRLLQEADRLAWLRAWTRAEPLYAKAEQLFADQGDRRNALYARINHLRGELPRLAVPEVSAKLAEYLDDPLVQADDQLRLRCLVIKGDTDVNLDPSLAERTWREALRLAEELGEAAWANRARGELGLVAFLQGDVDTSVIRLGQALKVVESNGDISSQVRWLTLFGQGYVQLDRPQSALKFFDRALKLARSVPDIGFPLMTYVGQGNALVKLKRVSDAEGVLNEAISVAKGEGALGYHAELLLTLGLIAYKRGQTEPALRSLDQAADLARRAGGDRILVEIALERGRIERDRNQHAAAERAFREGVEVARKVQRHFLLPRLLAELADLKASEQQYVEAAALLDEANDLLEGLFTNTSSPWARSRLVSGMDTVFLAQIRLEGARRNASRLFAVVEQARGRALLDLLRAKPIADVPKPAELREGERRIAALQIQLFRATSPDERRRLLEQIFVAEERLAPASTVLFDRSQRGPREPVGLTELQHVLRPDELFLSFALAEPHSYCLVVTRASARVQELPSHSVIRRQLESVLSKLQAEQHITAEIRTLSTTLLAPVSELAEHSRLIVNPDAELTQLPFELLTTTSGARLLNTHVVSYVPSGSVMTVLREHQPDRQPPRVAFAVSASPPDERLALVEDPAVERGTYDLDLTELPPLPSANEEARSVASILGTSASSVLVDSAATEAALKREPLHEYRVVHFAAHGVLSTSFPARSALVVEAGGGEDGLLQAREILALRLSADLVTLSACDTGAGGLYGQDGVLSLVRPFLAVGARSVVANLWAAKDLFSLSLMKAFYGEIAKGADVADALRHAKLSMLERFGDKAVPKLWSGVLVYGDGDTVVAAPQAVGN
ncbi:MAG: CHAT domain-containing protein [Vicinamibacteraceae bacterium]